MKTVFILILIAGMIAPVPADSLYRCTSGKTVLYTDLPCDTDTQPIRDLPKPTTTQQARPDAAKPPAGSRVNVQINNTIRQSNTSHQPPTQHAHGLAFRDFRLLKRGQSVAQVLAIAGPPDRQAVDSINTELGIKKTSFYYVSMGQNASITRIRFINGTVSSLERELPPY